jgi:RHS repeat-associated protein
LTSYDYDLNRNLLSATDGRGVVTSYAYDALNRRTEVLQAYQVPAGIAWDPGAPATTSTDYDAADNVVQVTDPLGHSTSFTYDKLNYRRTVTTRFNITANGFDSATTTMTYDKVGNLLSVEVPPNDPTVQPPQSHITSYQYDALNRRTLQIDGFEQAANEQRRTTMSYDLDDNLTEVVNPLNQRTTYVYDSFNRRTVTLTTTQAGVARVTTTYDVNNNVTQVQDADGNTTAYEFDALNRRVKMTDPRNNSATFLYDAAGNLKSSTDRDGRVRNLTYDALNRVETETWVPTNFALGDFLTYAYDAGGNLTRASNTAGTVTMTYDALNHLETVQEPFNVTLTNTYDAAGRRTQVQDSLGGVTVSVYDEVNRLTTRIVSVNGAPVFQIQLGYTKRNELNDVKYFESSNGTFQPVAEGQRHYTPFGEVGLLTWTYAGDGSTLEQFEYRYDNAGRLVYEQRGTLGGPGVFNYWYSFDYDADGQLTGYLGADGNGPFSHSYTYTANGNRQSEDGQPNNMVDPGNLIRQDALWNYAYDGEGNLIGRSRLDGSQRWEYSYDHANHLVEAVQYGPNAVKVRDVLYVYDALGRRIERLWDDGQGNPVSDQRYAYDGDNVLADLDGQANNALSVRYIRGDIVDQLFARLTPNPTGSAQERMWYLTDRLGSKVNLITADGTSREQVRYQPFGGQVMFQTTLTDRFGFTGRELDSGSLFQYNRFRWYYVEGGRWISQDPLGFAAGDANLYRYVGNSPTNVVDPLGLFGGIFTKQWWSTWWDSVQDGFLEKPRLVYDAYQGVCAAFTEDDAPIEWKSRTAQQLAADWKRVEDGTYQGRFGIDGAAGFGLDFGVSMYQSAKEFLHPDSSEVQLRIARASWNGIVNDDPREIGFMQGEAAFDVTAIVATCGAGRVLRAVPVGRAFRGLRGGKAPGPPDPPLKPSTGPVLAEVVEPPPKPSEWPKPFEPPKPPELEAPNTATPRRFLFAEMEEPAFDSARPALPEFDGTTRGYIVPTQPPGAPVPMQSGPRTGARFPYSQADGHLETNAANWMAKHNVTRATVYHNNPSGTCPNCNNYLPTFLEEASVMEVVPPPNAIPRTPRWIAEPRTYTGNSRSPY